MPAGKPVPAAAPAFPPSFSSLAATPTMRPLPTLLALLAAAAFGGFAASGLDHLLDQPARAAETVRPAPALVPAMASLPAAVNGQAMPSLAPMLQKVMPAVVSVNTKQVVRVRNPFA